MNVIKVNFKDKSHIKKIDNSDGLGYLRKNIELSKKRERRLAKYRQNNNNRARSTEKYRY